MQYSLYINQKKATEWGLTPQQSILFSFLYELPSWAECHIISGIPYYYITKKKILAELPLLNSKPDTVYRWIRTLSALGLINIIQQGTASLVGITQKGSSWNREASIQSKRADLGCSSEVPDRDPSLPGCASDMTSDAHPTNHYTNNQITKPYHQVVIPEKGFDGDQINEYLDLVVKPISQGKKDPQGYFETVRSRLLQHGLSSRDLAQLASIRRMEIKDDLPPPPDIKQPIVSESWENAMKALKNTLGETCFDLWISPLRCVRDDTVIELIGIDRFFCAHIKTNFLERIRDELPGKEVLISPEI